MPVVGGGSLLAAAPVMHQGCPCPWIVLSDRFLWDTDPNWSRYHIEDFLLIIYDEQIPVYVC